MPISDNYYHGKNGKAWVSGNRYTNTYNLSVIITKNYEEITDPRDGHYGKVQIPNGWSGTGTLTLRRDGTEQELIDAYVDSASNNGIEDIDIIAKMESNNGKVNRYKYGEVTFDSMTIQEFAHDTAITEMELPFKFATVEKL
ncbi:phage tail tube protein [Tepidibacter mesophilus]|uniref:phage tail tube protein n=1 Tax=Tepidibacter mesophilus TaxID=655607 RepID=UPI000C06A047|nr:phage tail tube protein [Tepidibacter mesophilus]